MKYDHFTLDRDDPCPECGEPRLWAWYDADEQNGRSEARWGPDDLCVECHREEGGKAKSLKDVARKRKEMAK